MMTRDGGYTTLNIMTNPITKIQVFFNEVGVELKKSAWPTRKELVDSTIVVIIAVALLGVFVAFADYVFIQTLKLLMRAH